MFSDEEFKVYQSDFEKIGFGQSQEDMKSILDFLYSFGVIAYEYNIGKKDCENGKEKG
ncbi:hypothetical protein [Dysgonomonas sp. 520]|uniref:hypothetical protein n=1 Tax=Dysgonomonas sp. 520 TaxID=2302931 RepID=UPI00162A47C2|nr:hypothetical protein [Dysgonomonas sp. 520]